MQIPDVLVEVLPQLSVGVVSVLSLVYIVRYLSKKHAEEMGFERAGRTKSQEAFIAFIQAHNHEFTKLVIETRNAIHKTGQSIDQNTEQNKVMIDIVTSLLNK